MNMRNTPELTFILDKTIEYGVDMSKKIDDVIAQMPEREEESTED
jgi:ribosome-binding factor A